MDERQRRAWGELRQAAAFYQDGGAFFDWYDGGRDLDGHTAFGHATLSRVADLLEAAGGRRELAAAQLVRALHQVLVELTAEVYRGWTPPRGLPPEIRDIFGKPER